MQWAQVPSDSQLHICGKPVRKTVLSPEPVAAAKYTSKLPLWNLIHETSGMLPLPLYQQDHLDLELSFLGGIPKTMAFNTKMI